MATCKDCLHYEVCTFHITENENEKCPHFKDKSQYAEVKHGHWIDKPSGRYLHIASWCSACGNKSGIGGIESNRHKPYCPNCGADMRGLKCE
jgi:hypothetical protein